MVSVELAPLTTAKVAAAIDRRAPVVRLRLEAPIGTRAMPLVPLLMIKAPAVWADVPPGLPLRLRVPPPRVSPPLPERILPAGAPVWEKSSSNPPPPIVVPPL